MKKENKKGFTLVELLAVIVILAVIALITTPMIQGVIESSRKNAALRSVEGILDAGEKYILEKVLGETTGTSQIDLTKDILNYKGNKPTKGILLIGQDNNLSIIAQMGNYCIEKKFNESEVKMVEKKSCELDDSEKIRYNQMIGLNKSENECVTNSNRVCTVEEIKEGIKVSINVNKDTNYMFYVLNDNGDTLDLQLHINMKGTVAWASNEDYLEVSGHECASANPSKGCNDYGPVTLLKRLKEETQDWINIPNQSGIISYRNHQIDMSEYKARLVLENEFQNLGCSSYVAGKVGTCPTWFGDYYWTMRANYYNSTWAGWESAASFIINQSINATYVVNKFLSYRPVITVPKSKIFD